MKRSLDLLCLLAVWSAGCIVYTPPKPKQANAVAEASKADEKPAEPTFDTEKAKLIKAKQHLEAKEWTEAERLALEVRAMLRERDDKPKNDYPTCKDFDGTRCRATDWDLNHWFDWFSASTAIAGLARTNARDELAGLTAFEREGLDPKRCPQEFVKICEEMEAVAQKADYVDLFQKIEREPAGGGSRYVKTGRLASNYYYLSIPGMAGYSAESVGYFLDEQVNRRLRKNHKRYGAVWIGNHYEAKRTERPVGARTGYVWKGTTQKISGTSCTNTGRELKIGANTYDIQACRKSSHISQAATVTMNLSAEDAAQVDFDNGDAALVIFETAKVGGSKLNLNLGAVRLARVARKGETLQ